MLEALFRSLRPKPARGEPVVVSPRVPLVSIVLGSYNRCVLLKHAIASARENAAFARHEIIVIDGGSTDGSLEWLQSQKDIITIIQHNRGVVNGKAIERRSWGYFMNLGFKIAQGKYILMISDDCILLPGSIENGIKAFEEAVERGERIGGVAFYFRNWPLEDDYYVQRTLGGKLMVNHGLFLRSALESIDWVDEETYHFYKADGDLSLRLWQAGYEVIDAQGAYVEHYMDATESVRILNNQTLNHDSKGYSLRWGALIKSPDHARMGKVKTSYKDEQNTAEKMFGEYAGTRSSPE